MLYTVINDCNCPSPPLFECMSCACLAECVSCHYAEECRQEVYRNSAHSFVRRRSSNTNLTSGRDGVGSVFYVLLFSSLHLLLQSSFCAVDICCCPVYVCAVCCDKDGS